MKVCRAEEECASSCSCSQSGSICVSISVHVHFVPESDTGILPMCSKERRFDLKHIKKSPHTEVLSNLG